MANLTEVAITNGIPTSGTGTVSTIDAIAPNIATLASGAIDPGTALVPSADVLTIGGTVLHDDADTGAPVGVGLRAIAHGTNPTAVAAADKSVWYCNRAGVPFMIGGHPNVICKTWKFTAAQTDTALVTIATGLKVVVTHASVVFDDGTTTASIQIGFGTANTPTPGTGGVANFIEGTFAAGGGISKGAGSGMLAVGADNEDVRVTTGTISAGAVRITLTYYTIET